MYSEDLGSASQGGKLDWTSPNVFDPAFKDELLKLKKNEISQPFHSSFGWHIVQLLDKRIEDTTDQSKLNNAKRTLFNRKFAEETNNWLRQLRSKAVVKFIDNDATVN